MMNAKDNPVVLSVENLTVRFETKYGSAAAVNDISFQLHKGEKLGLVGESGSGKSVTAKSILRLLPSPPAKTTGKVVFNDVDLLSLSVSELRKYRGNRISMIFQEPMVSLNPLFSVGNQLREVVMLHKGASAEEANQEAIEMLHSVGIPSPEIRMKQYPFELSGGMRQRVMIAMALLCGPQILIADEPTTALDVTIQAQILELIESINRDLGTSLILITHDLGVIAELVDTVAVMYAGTIVEQAAVRDVFYKPLHPYTEGLLKSIPTMEIKEGELETIEGNVPSIYQLPYGCPFHNRCKDAWDLCEQKVPPVFEVDGCKVKCWKYAAEEEKRGSHD